MSTLSRIIRALRRRGLTPRLIAVLVIVVPVGAAAVATAVLGRVPTATALIAVLVTGALVALLELRRRATVTDQGVRDLRVMVEQTQRRLVAAAEHERVAAADRHQVVLAELAAVRDRVGGRADLAEASDAPLATIPIPASLRDL